MGGRSFSGRMTFSELFHFSHSSLRCGKERERKGDGDGDGEDLQIRVQGQDCNVVTKKRTFLTIDCFSYELLLYSTACERFRRILSCLLKEGTEMGVSHTVVLVLKRASELMYFFVIPLSKRVWFCG